MPPLKRTLAWTLVVLAAVFFRDSLQQVSVLTACDFEKDFCSFEQDKTDAANPLSSETGTHDWERRGLPTFTDNTGPSSAQQGTGYAFVDASHPMKPGQSARLLSPVLGVTGQVCVDFWYHMYGQHIKELRLYTQPGLNSQQRQDSFSQKGNQGDKWYQVQQTVNLETPQERIGFSAVRGDGYEGDIAIDTVVVSRGACEGTKASASQTNRTGLTLPFSCSFETGLCGITQRTSDDFDWKRQTGPTPSGDTGPDGAQSGEFYLYIEASRPQQKGHKAYPPGECTYSTYSLELPPIKSYSGAVCISFVYHMYDKAAADNMGSLKVFKDTQGEGQAVFLRHGNQNNTWHNARETLTITDEEDKIVFLGIVGNDYHSDIAIDNLSVSEGTCSGGLLFECGFESDLCGMVQSTNDSFDWTRRSGTTDTKDTGPDGASEGQFYLYTEASNPRKPGDTAVLTTPAFSHTGPVCVWFKYHMYGKTHMGTLQLYTASTTGTMAAIFEKSANQGNGWLSAEVEASLTGNQRIVFSGSVGSGIRSDMALDQVKVTEGGCGGDVEDADAADPLAFRCDFEQDLCGMHNEVAGATFNWTRHQGITQTTGTGPIQAYNGSYYVYIEASNPRKAGDTAILSTPAFNASGSVCVEFLYHMLDETTRSMGSLRVYSSRAGDGEVLFSRSAGQGQEWNKAQFQHEMQQGEEILFAGERGSGIQGDIALDLIHIKTGSCDSSEKRDLPYRCDFTDDLCGMTEHTDSMLTPELNHAGDVCVRYQHHEFGDDTEESSQTSVLELKIETQKQITIPGISRRDVAGKNVLDWIEITKGFCEKSENSGTTEETPSNLPLSCDFEQNLCELAQTSSDQLDWTRHSGRTPSQNTGPESAQSGKHYVYVEMSDISGEKRKKMGDTASLEIPLYHNGAVCVEFYYHALGSTLGSFTVYADSQGEREAVFEVSEDQGVQWKKAEIETKVEYGGKLYFVAVRGSGIHGDVAMDNLSIIPGSCDSTETTTTPGAVLLPFSCDLEEDFCGLQQDSDSTFDWSRYTGGTPTQSTGPDKAYSGSYYMYIETSGQGAADAASISTPELVYEGRVCASFYYHMYGTGMGTLKVFTTSGNQDEPIFQQTGDQGNQWKAAEIEADLTPQDRVHFMGIRGDSIRSDIAVDKIEIRRGGCQKTVDVPFRCGFEVDWCGLSVATGSQSNWTRHTGETATTNTGPGSAHAGAYYIYTEASGVQPEQLFVLETPLLAISTESVCIRFYYHMNGEDMGTLAVYKDSQTDGNLLYTTQGNQGDEWMLAEIQVEAEENLKMVLVGRRGSGIKSDLALDDLSVNAGPCTGDTKTKTMLLPYLCDFESDLCGLEDRMPGYQLNWTRHSGETASRDTGPAEAHSGDYYLYIEASGASQGHKAFLASPAFESSGLVCVQLYYHMYGADMGSLKVYINQQETQTPITEITNNQANQWKQLQLEITVEKNDQIAVIGERGSGFRGDLAIDDFQIDAGTCEQASSEQKQLVPLPYHCDFEEEEDSETACGLVQPTTEQLDWVRTNKPTGSKDTGPEAAATGTYYMYVEASATQNGDRARLETPAFNHSGGVCVEFHYHMFGAEMGSLTVYTVRGDGSQSAVFERSDSQGEDWKAERQDLELTPGDRLVFEGAVGAGLKSDIALDDLDISPGSCDQQTKPETEILKCGFEAGFCQFSQSSEDDFDWLRVTGATPSSETGPEGAYSGTYYTYFEASSKQQGETASLESGVLEYSGKACISFYYHMFGPDMGALKVMQVTAEEEEVMLELSGNHGDEWKKAQMSAALLEEAKVVFQGVRGSGFKGDISLDNIQIISGSCEETSEPVKSVSLPFGCDFERDLCDFHQKTTDEYSWVRTEAATLVTGPDQAGSGLYYALAEGRNQEEGYKAVLESPGLQYSGVVCLSLQVYMSDQSGEEMGSLTVYRHPQPRPLETGAGQSRVQLFKQSGDHGKEWRNEFIEADIGDGDQVVFQAENGQGPNSDIALDHINITAGPCDTNTDPGEGQATLPYTCTFESGLCNMRQKYDDDFDWLRRNTATETRGTGPDEAHNGDYYMYAEASIPRQEGHKAVLESPELLHSGMVCISFYYQMYDEESEEMGELTLHLNQRFENSPVFQVSGDRGPEWQEVRISHPIKRREQLVLIATRGPGIRSDIAIDQLQVLPYSCEDADSRSTVPTKSKPGDLVLSVLSCDMERYGGEETSCRLRQDTNDQLQWVQGQGHTPSGYMLKNTGDESKAVTGPKSAHRGDHYVYLEASLTDPGQTAKLLLEGSLTQEIGYNCLRFSYIMNGFHIGSLAVYSKRGGVYYTLWMMDGHQSTDWQQAVVELNTRQVTEVGFVGSSGDGFSGDIALDDVTLAQGKCQSSSSQYLFECSFEMANNVPTLCGMEQETTDTPHFDWMLWSQNTPSDETGPLRAYSGQYYIYAEASKPRQQGDQARILLPQLSYSGSVCVAFHYYMHGHHMGELELYTQHGETRTRHMTIAGPQGNEWLVTRRTLEEIDHNDQIGFRAIRGTEYSADIALDNVRVTRGEC